MTEFTPLASLVGGALIGCAATLLMTTNGRVAGISGIVRALLPPKSTESLWPRLAFIIGLVAAPICIEIATNADVLQTVSSDLIKMGIAGVLVGFGSVFGSGCTSGHGVCGLARLSTRSLAATATFMLVAIVTVYFSRHVFGG